MQAIRTPLTEGNIPRHMIRLTIPFLIAMGFQTLFALTDLFFVGRLGGQAVAGLTISLNAFFVILMMSHAIGVGGIALISQAWGREEHDEARRIYNRIIVLTLALGLLFWAAGYLSSEAYIHFFTEDALTRQLGIEYFSIYSATFFLQFFLIVNGFCFRGTGDFITPMAIMLTSIFLNLILDPILIFGLGPFPELGLQGAAIASVVSQCVSTTALVVIILGRRKNLYIMPTTLDLPAYRRIIRIGIPAGIQYLIMAILIALTYRAVRSYGPLVIAAIGIGFRLLHASYLPMISVSAATSTLVGQNYGAGKHGRVLSSMHWGIFYSLGWSFIITSLFLLFPSAFLSVFVEETDVITYGIDYLRTFGLSNLVLPLIFIVGAGFQGLGRTGVPLVGATLKIVLYVILLGVLSARGSLTIHAVYLSALAGVIAEAVWSGYILKRLYRDCGGQ